MQGSDQKLHEKLDLPTFIAGLVAGFLAFNNEPWWTLTSSTNNRVLAILASPFYLQISATSIPATIPLAALIGAISRILLIMSSVMLIGSSFRITTWWRPIATWLSMASLTEIFFSLFLLIHAGQATLFSTYGANPPMSGTLTYPARIVGTDLNMYLNPNLTASFNVDFYLGILSLTIVGTTTILKMLHEQDIVNTHIPGVKELFLSPPYRNVWISTSDRELNPLCKDPENTTDDILLESFGRIYNTVQAGGIVSIIFPSWATNVTDRFQKLLAWTGFTAETIETIYRNPSRPEIQLRFRKPVQTSKTEVLESEPETKPVLGLETELEGPTPDTPLQLSISSQPDWAQGKMTRQDRAMLRSAVSILSKRQDPMPYRELLNQVYMELVEKKVRFDSATQIENSLLKHLGRELALVEETDKEGFKAAKKWALGQDVPSEQDGAPSVLTRLAGHRPRASHVARLLRKWERKPMYRAKPEADET